jgi:hypothetical protein
VANAPEVEYQQRLEVLRRDVNRRVRQDGRIANARLAVFILTVAALWWAFVSPSVPWALGILLAIGFGALMVVHARVLHALTRGRLLIGHYERALDRIHGNWAGRGSHGEGFVPDDHPYARDLDLFGEGSVFELLSTARTRIGEHKLATWLLEPAGPETMRARQQAVEELRHRLALREDLALFGEDIAEHVNPHALQHWTAAEPAFASATALRGARTALGVTAAALLAWPWLGPLPLVLMLAINLMLLARSRHPLQEVTRGIEEPRRELLVLARVLARLEQEPFESPLLVDLHHHLHADGRAASRRLARLDKLAYLLELPGNQLFAPVAIATLWSIHVAYALEQWRERYGPYVPQWLDAVGALEALLALATYAYEHPSDPFPELVEGSILFDGRQLAHPILPENLCVRNSVCLDDALRLLVVSGSNMSGKSTLLRMVGVNAVLAQAGAPVRAEALRMSPLALGATLRVQDSLQSGASRFYAEIERLKQVMDLAENGATLFLFDEILSGTNSHDRRIGAAEVLRALLDRGAAGIVTTHDLALTQIADHLGAIASNVHFTDEWRDGAIIFPYTLKPGVVRQGNALRLMARLGLPVGPDDDRFANLESAPPQ